MTRLTGKPRSANLKIAPPRVLEAQAVSDASDASEEASVPFIGFIDRVERYKVFGWAYDPSHPDEPVIVEASVSNGINLHAVADAYREDVKLSGYGNGYHGFELDFSELNVKSETVVVRFLDTKQPLAETPIDFDPQRAFLSCTMPKAYGDLIMRLGLEIKQKHATQIKVGGYV